MAGGGLSQQTILHHHRLLYSALEQAVRWQYLARNPAANVEPPRPPRVEMKGLSGDQVATLLDATESTPYYLPILLAFATGMRRGEIVALK